MLSNNDRWIWVVLFFCLFDFNSIQLSHLLRNKVKSTFCFCFDTQAKQRKITNPHSKTQHREKETANNSNEKKIYIMYMKRRHKSNEREHERTHHKYARSLRLQDYIYVFFLLQDRKKRKFTWICFLLLRCVRPVPSELCTCALIECYFTTECSLAFTFPFSPASMEIYSKQPNTISQAIFFCFQTFSGTMLSTCCSAHTEAV